MNDMVNLALIAVRLYAAENPVPPSVTQKQAASMIGLSAQTVCKMVRRGDIKLNSAGMIPYSEIQRMLKPAL